MRIRTCSIDHSIRLWDGQENTWADPIVQGRKEVATAVVSPNREWAAEATDRWVSWWPMAGRSRGHKQELYSTPRHLAFNHSGTLLAAVEDNGGLWIWHPQDSTMGNPIAMPAAAYSVEFSHDDKVLAVAGFDLVVRLFDVESRKLLRTFKGHTARVYDIAFSPDDSEIALATGRGQVKIWSVDTGSSLRQLERRFSNAFAAALSGDGKWLAVVKHDRSVWLHPLEAISKPPVNVPILRLPWEQDGAVPLSASVLKPRRITPDASYELSEPEPGRMPHSLRFTQDSKYLLADTNHGPWRVWSMSRAGATLVADQAEAFAIDLFHPRGLRAVGGSYSTELLIKPIGSDSVLQRQPELNHILNAQFDLTGDRIVVCDLSGVHLWHLANDHFVKIDAKIHQDLGWAKHCTFSPAGDLFAIAHDNHVVLYHAGDGARHAVLHLRAHFAGPMKFSPDGRTLATSSLDATIQLWHVPTGQEMLRLDNAERSRCCDLGFSKNGDTLYSIGIDENNEGALLAWPTR